MTGDKLIAAKMKQRVDLRRYWSALDCNKWTVLCYAVLASLIAGLAVFAMTPWYGASVTMLMEPQQLDAFAGRGQRGP